MVSFHLVWPTSNVWIDKICTLTMYLKTPLRRRTYFFDLTISCIHFMLNRCPYYEKLLTHGKQTYLIQTTV